MVAFWFKTFLLVSLILIMPFSYGMADSFQGGMQTSAKYSVEQGGMIQMSSSRKLLQVQPDYENPHANPRHSPRSPPGKEVEPSAPSAPSAPSSG